MDRLRASSQSLRLRRSMGIPAGSGLGSRRRPPEGLGATLSGCFRTLAYRTLRDFLSVFIATCAPGAQADWSGGVVKVVSIAADRAIPRSAIGEAGRSETRPKLDAGPRRSRRARRCLHDHLHRRDCDRPARHRRPRVGVGRPGNRRGPDLGRALHRLPPLRPRRPPDLRRELRRGRGHLPRADRPARSRSSCSAQVLRQLRRLVDLQRGRGCALPRQRRSSWSRSSAARFAAGSSRT